MHFAMYWRIYGSLLASPKQAAMLKNTSMLLYTPISQAQSDLMIKSLEKKEQRTSKALLAGSLGKDWDIRQRMYPLSVIHRQGAVDNKASHGVFRIYDVVVLFFGGVDSRLSWTYLMYFIVFSMVGIGADCRKQGISMCMVSLILLLITLL